MIQDSKSIDRQEHVPIHCLAGCTKAFCIGMDRQIDYATYITARVGRYVRWMHVYRNSHIRVASYIAFNAEDSPHDMSHNALATANSGNP